MDKIGVLLSILGSVKVLIEKDNIQDYRGAGVKRTIVTTIKVTHETIKILEFCFENNILLCRLPSHTSHKLQPCDVGVFAPLKTAHRDQVERLNQGGIDRVGKEHFTSLYKPAWDRAITKRNIIAGWAATSLFPFNPERVLRGIQKPPATLTIPKTNNKAVRSSPQEVLQTPVTPVTPVRAESLTSLQNLIKQDAHALDKISKQRLERHVEKMATAAQISFAECGLLQDQTRFLFGINNEAKVRRSTRSIVLGKAKVISFEDLGEAPAKRDAKEKAIASKGNRSRKRKNPQETEAGPSAPEEAEAGPSAPKVVRMS
ncbi:DDE-domain-containing protein [Lepidopterella palustris CBS 459.81]|uniref:DDE-domain-containing protein n=1 Tax=Lepidopterella palustris CBS 459.81 TaxID=1314670 RepID=A0A8E2E2U5_9PEZI|nr:DDE-domain-containing protein [Lepidopterella palustris CBS 459.81]